jgi:predicted negative regulator of RcsB-dependent stress response
MTTRIRILIAVAGLVLFGSVFPAQADTIMFKEAGKKNLTGKIEVESAKGVQFAGKGAFVAADAIADVDYDIASAEIRLYAYRPATSAERAALKAPEAKRPALLDDAIAKYAVLLDKIKAPELAFVKRHARYKVAYLTTLKADLIGTGAARALAIDKFKSFTADERDGWQTPVALETLARLQVEQQDYEGAAQALEALAKALVSEETRQDAQLRLAKLSMQAGKYEAALPKLDALIAALPKDSPYVLRTRLAKAECLAQTKDVPAATALLEGVLKEANERDRETRAAAHNTLGLCYLLGDQPAEARWQFLWVDLVYNQNKAEQAKALYYLARVFARLNQPERADACRQTLLSDPQLAGTEFHERARKEQAK